MSPPTDVAEPIRVIHHREGSHWWAESPDVEGWTAAGDSFAEVVELSEEGIPFALELPVELEHYVDETDGDRSVGGANYRDRS